MRGRTLVAALALLAGACSGDDKDRTDAGFSGADASTLCAAWRSGDQETLDAAAEGYEPADFLNQIQVNCNAYMAASKRHVAPPENIAVPALTLCDTLPVPPSVDDGSRMRIYGDARAADPYKGRMLALLWNRSSGSSHRGDGKATPLTVQGRPGVAAPITVFQQTVLPELGTVIAWSDDGHNFGLYGRGWNMASKDDLLRIANSVLVTGDGPVVASLPPGYGQLFYGRPSAASLVLLAANPLYLLHFKQGDTGVLHAGGFDMSAEAFQAFRFFATDIAHRRVGNHDALVGTAWGKDGPAVVTWREPDGLVVRIVGVGVTLEKALAVASATRELDDDEWIDVVEHDVDCNT